MKLIDYIFYVETKWQTTLLRKNISDSSFSSCLAMSLWFTWFIVGCICLFGLLMPNPLAELADDWIAHLVLSALLLVPLLMRYLKGHRTGYVDGTPFETIQKQRNKMSAGKRSLYYLLFLVYEIGIPLYVFIAFRLYFIGKVAWW